MLFGSSILWVRLLLLALWSWGGWAVEGAENEPVKIDLSVGPRELANEMVVASKKLNPPFAATALYVARLPRLIKYDDYQPKNFEGLSAVDPLCVIEALHYLLRSSIIALRGPAAIESVLGIDTETLNEILVDIAKMNIEVAGTNGAGLDFMEGIAPPPMLWSTIMQKFRAGSQYSNLLLRIAAVEMLPEYSIDISIVKGIGLGFMNDSEPVGKTLSEAVTVLNNGVVMPLLAFGTWTLSGNLQDRYLEDTEEYDPLMLDKEEDALTYPSVLAALNAGYRHIDTAQVHLNERMVAMAIKKSGIPRDQLFITGKLSSPEQYRRDLFLAEFERQLKRLQIDYFDLYMLQEPADDPDDFMEAWSLLQSLYRQKRIRAFGLSNIFPQNLTALLDKSAIVPQVVQNPFTIYHQGAHEIRDQVSMVKLCREKNITLMGYGALSGWPLELRPMEDPLVRDIAQDVGRTPAQVLQRFVLQQGVGIVARTINPKHLQENLDVLSFELSDEIMQRLIGITMGTRTYVNNPHMFTYDIYDYSLSERLKAGGCAAKNQPSASDMFARYTRIILPPTKQEREAEEQARLEQVQSLAAKGKKRRRMVSEPLDKTRYSKDRNSL